MVTEYPALVLVDSRTRHNLGQRPSLHVHRPDRHDVKSIIPLQIPSRRARFRLGWDGSSANYPGLHPPLHGFL